MIGKSIKQKLNLDYIQAPSLRELLSIVNNVNKTVPDNPIIKDDIVKILKNEDDYILIYYR